MTLARPRYNVDKLTIHIDPSYTGRVDQQGNYYENPAYINQVSVKWLACTMAHELHHVNVWSAPEASANYVLLDCIKWLGGTQSEIRYAESLVRNPHNET